MDTEEEEDDDEGALLFWGFWETALVVGADGALGAVVVADALMKSKAANASIPLVPVVGVVLVVLVLGVVLVGVVLEPPRAANASMPLVPVVLVLVLGVVLEPPRGCRVGVEEDVGDANRESMLAALDPTATDR